MEFSQFCACGPSGYALLKQRVDTCAGLGRSYEFDCCRLPEGCRPPQAQLGFGRDGKDYLLYFRPAVSYRGENPLLRDFFQQGAVRRFNGFQAMTDCLRALDSTALPGDSLLRRLMAEFRSQVVGQDQAVEAASFKLWSHICKRAPIRPLSLIFYGPTGVGKSELAKAVAPTLNRCLGQQRYQLVWTELNTFTEPHSVYRLTGAPPGYVGYDDPPVLEAVRRCPHTVFMFDELDKAHPEVLKTFMSILDEGRSTARREDAQGRRELDFRRCVLLFTTNTDLSSHGVRLGFAVPAGAEPGARLHLPTPAGLAGRLYQADESARRALARSGVLREIAGRFGGLIGFQPLDEQARTAVTIRQIAALGREYGLDITQVATELARALTPREAISPRSTVPMLEGVLTPVFLSGAPLAERRVPLQLTGTLEQIRLVPLS